MATTILKSPWYRLQEHKARTSIVRQTKKDFGWALEMVNEYFPGSKPVLEIFDGGHKLAIGWKGPDGVRRARCLAEGRRGTLWARVVWVREFRNYIHELWMEDFIFRKLPKHFTNGKKPLIKKKNSNKMGKKVSKQTKKASKKGKKRGKPQRGKGPKGSTRRKSA